MEIGSVYEIDPAQVEKAGQKTVGALCLDEVVKYQKQHTSYTASGREAISLALKSLEKEQPDVCKKCLMPAYMCDSVFLPFEQNGWELVFYSIGKNMKADIWQLKSLITNEKPGMLFIHAYYGVDTWKELRPLLKEYQKNGLIVMEDVTQSYYLKTDFGADYIVGSLRKWYAIADGGFVTTNRLLYGAVMECDETFAGKRAKMLMKKWEYLQASQSGAETDFAEKKHHTEKTLSELKKEKEEYLAVNRQLEEYLDQNEQIREMSSLSVAILSDINENKCKERRNANYRILQDGLQNKKTLTLVFEECKIEAVPLYLPVYMKDRDSLQQYLRERDIYVPVLWPIGKENADCLSEDEKYIFSHIAAIPMDQRYGKEDMERIIAAIEAYESNRMVI